MMMTDYKLKTLSKNGFVRLPNTWLNEVDLTTGDLVDIYYEDRKIIIEPSMGESFNNQRYINRDKKVLIPKELRKQGKLFAGCPYVEMIDSENHRLIIDTT
ncbi:AbrB/MazE/SpoVT family DNA-binding domain-containing protein [Oceanobacillus sp. CAU 1775]